jgi:hypothetical protein
MEFYERHRETRRDTEKDRKTQRWQRYIETQRYIHRLIQKKGRKGEKE